MRKPKVKLNSESHYSFRIQEHSQKYYNKLWSTPADNDADTILQWLYDRGLVQNYIKKLEYDTIDDETVQDIIQEIWLYLVEKKDKLKELYDTQGITGLTAYVSGIIARQVHSASSSIYNKYKKDYKKFVHLSEQCWEDFYNTGKMMETRTEYLMTESDIDLVNKYIETNQLDKLYETEGKTKNNKRH